MAARRGWNNPGDFSLAYKQTYGALQRSRLLSAVETFLAPDFLRPRRPPNRSPTTTARG
ncbi:hypothetical protein [Streptomyces californicus]|uniref:hypothetical protein n=1 Tax=Streptomyces californicus TaxID=67351 RepID=UPI00296F0371|nr:hypothetical protein [Streptomyces californicus]MDW4918296.1 hypothetical protein [Streptomyces californicus]